MILKKSQTWALKASNVLQGRQVPNEDEDQDDPKERDAKDDEGKLRVARSPNS